MGIKRKVGAHLDTQHTLTEHDVAHSAVDVLLLGGTGGDHVTIAELHRLGALSAQLAAHNNLATLSAVLHDETEHTVARAEKHRRKIKTCQDCEMVHGTGDTGEHCTFEMLPMILKSVVHSFVLALLG
eukprot:1180876-Prorocentrum_minimum.AAC.2